MSSWGIHNLDVLVGFPTNSNQGFLEKQLMLMDKSNAEKAVVNLTQFLGTLKQEKSLKIWMEHIKRYMDQTEKVSTGIPWISWA